MSIAMPESLRAAAESLQAELLAWMQSVPHDQLSTIMLNADAAVRECPQHRGFNVPRGRAPSLSETLACLGDAVLRERGYDTYLSAQADQLHYANEARAALGWMLAAERRCVK